MAITIRDSQIVLHSVGGYDTSFEIANEDTSGATYYYYGYISTEGFWIIQRRQAGTNTAEYKYSCGKTISDYSSAWHSTTKIYQGSFAFYRIDQMLSNRV